MPQQATTTTNQTDDNYTAIDPRKDPIGFVYQNKDALGRMDPDKAVKFVDMMFRRYAMPKYQQVNQQRPLDEDELGRLRLQFAARMFGIPYEQETKLKDPEVKRGVLEKAGAALEAGGAGVIGGLRTIEELREKLQKIPYAGKALQYDPVNIGLKKLMTPAGKAEGKAFESAQTISPRIADISAGLGHQIPATVATHGVESALPAAGKAASLGVKALSGGARGAAGGATFEASRPGGDPGSGAVWGGVLGAAFPILGRMFGLGRTAKAAAPEVAKAAGVSGEVGASAAKATPKTLGDVAEATAKSKFGKSFKDLTPAEKAQMPQVMKEEITRQRAQQMATKKAEVAAAKAGRETEEAAKRAEKAKIASEKAAKQAERRAAVPATSPAQKQAVAAKAAEENPTIAKVVAPVEKRVAEGVSPTGAERRKTLMKGVTTVYDQPTEGEKLAKDIRASSAPTTTITEGEALQHIMKDPQKYELYKAADTKAQGKMLVDAKNEMSKITKVAEGVEGKKIRAKEGKSASPAQQAADRERIAKKRELSKGEEFGKALEKHAQEMAGRHTAGSIGMMHIPELEETMKEFPNGELFLKGFQKLRKAGRITDELYVEEMKNWMLTQFEKGEPNRAAD